MTSTHKTGTTPRPGAPARPGTPEEPEPPEQPAAPEQPEAPDRPGRAAALPPDQRRAAIIDATLPLLREHGRTVTTRQIADAAGIAEGTIFRVFASKDELIEAAVDRALDVDDTIQAIGALDPGASLEQTIVRCAEILRDRMESVIDLMMALHRPENDADGHADHDPASKSHSRRRRRRDPNDPQHRAVIDAIAARLTPHADRLSYPPARAAQLLRLLTFAGTHRMVAHDDRLGPDEIAAVLLHGILRGPTQPPDTQRPDTQRAAAQPPAQQPLAARSVESPPPETGAAPGTPSYRPAYD